MRHKPNTKKRRMVADFGKRIKEARTWRKMTAMELGRRMGLTRAAISSVELNGTSMPAWRVTHVCQILDLDANWLLGLTK